MHFFRTFEVELIAGVTQPISIADGLARLDAQQNVMGLIIVLMQIVAVISGYNWNTGDFG
jgi:hypothetical protein